MDEPRFEFGRNWRCFLAVLDDSRIEFAQAALCNMLGIDDLSGKRFLDIGAGSGLSSLCARRLGASVSSFDYDAEAVACVAEIKRRYFPRDDDWSIERGSILDRAYVERLGTFDIVYSWGVLHHTGAMWAALENAGVLVAEGGTLFVSIYNDQRWISSLWRAVKRAYVGSPRAVQNLLLIPSLAVLWGPNCVKNLVLTADALKDWKAYRSTRGMSPWHDLVDWVGGFPFEVARPEEIFNYYRKRGFVLERFTTCGGGLGCNEFVFIKAGQPT